MKQILDKYSLLKKFLSIGGIFLLFLVFASCSEWLDLKPMDGVVENDYWKSKEDVYSVLTGCYTSLLDKTLVTNMIYWGELRAEVFTGGTAANNDIMNIKRGEITPENNIVKWDQFYKTINYCNKLIEKSALVRQLDQSFTDRLYNQYKAEAIVIRSLMYFYLVRSFSDVPFITKASDDDQQNYYVSKISGATVLDSLVRDLTGAIDHLISVETDFPTKDYFKGRMTRWSALTLLADIYLWQEDYANCVAACDQVIGSGQYSLIQPLHGEIVPVSVINTETMDTIEVKNILSTTFSDRLFDEMYVRGNSVESIFELQFPKEHPTLGNPFFDIFNNSNRPLVKPHEDIYPGDIIFPLYEHASEAPDVIDIRGSRISYKQDMFWKWVGTTASGTTTRQRTSFPHWIVYRYAEVLLMKAEALNQIAIRHNDRESLHQSYELVKQIMIRSNSVEKVEEIGGIVDGITLQNLILAERGREFIAEGKRWYDLLRAAKRDNFNGKATVFDNVASYIAPIEKVASLKEKFNSSNWFCYWPIHVTAIEINENLTQNEFYVNK
jgi:hypothetical protein